MPNMFERGMTYLASTLPAATGGSVTYSRGMDSVSVVAGFGTSDFQVETREGMVLTSSDRDFLIPVANLVFDETTVTPARGDKITTTDGEVYEVLAPVGFEVYRKDRTGTMIRIHTKRLS